MLSRMPTYTRVLPATRVGALTGSHPTMPCPLHRRACARAPPHGRRTAGLGAERDDTIVLGVPLESKVVEVASRRRHVARDRAVVASRRAAREGHRVRLQRRAERVHGAVWLSEGSLLPMPMLVRWSAQKESRPRKREAEKVSASRFLKLAMDSGCSAAQGRRDANETSVQPHNAGANAGVTREEHGRARHG